MKIVTIDRNERAFRTRWDDGSVLDLPYIWLRDNDPDELHPQTRERTFDLTSVALDICPDAFEHTAEGLRVSWPEKQRSSYYSADWLRAHRPGQRRHDPAVTKVKLWDSESLKDIPRANASECIRLPHEFCNTLLMLKRYGLLIVEGLDDNPDAGRAFGRLIGFKRETNFGTIFEVNNKIDPNNLAYTALALPLHTDLANQEAVPGYQFLHSYRNSTRGGMSVFADGFKVCADMEEAQPEQFRLLRETALPWRFHDEACDIRRHRPVINRDGDIDCFVFNAHLADIPDLETNKLYEFYAAYRALMIRIRDPEYAVKHLLAPGEMAVFDNQRVLHGRTAFEPASGERHFVGYYIEKNEVDSRIRVLSR